GGSVGNALKWFPDRRGLAAGLTAAGFGAGSAPTVVPIANMIASSGYEAAVWWVGIGQSILGMLVALLLPAPEPGEGVGAAGAAGRAAAPARLLAFRSAGAAGDSRLLQIPVFHHVSHVRDGRGRWSDGNRPACAHCQRLQDRRRASLNPWAHAPSAYLRLDDRSSAQWPLSAVLRLGVRPYWSREHDVHRLLLRRRRHLCVALLREQSVAVRDPVGTGVLRLGRDLFAVPGDMHRHLR